MAVLLTLYRRSGTVLTGQAEALVHEEITFPKLKDIDEIRVLPLVNGTTLLISPIKRVGLGTEVVRWTLEVVTDEKGRVDDEANKDDGIVTLALDKIDLAVLAVALETALSKDASHEEARRRLMRAIARKRGT